MTPPRRHFRRLCGDRRRRGGTVGCNYQTGQWVLGLEGDLSWTNMRGSAVEAAAFPATFSSETRENWLATVRGRLGWT